MKQTIKHCLLLVMVLAPTLLAGCLDLGERLTGGNNYFALSLSSNKKCPAMGELLHLKATVTNTTAQTQVIELDDRPVLDILIGNQETGVTRWSDGKALSPELTHLTLGPGQSKIIEMDWVVEKGTPVGAWFIPSASRANDPLSIQFMIPTFCPGIGT